MKKNILGKLTLGKRTITSLSGETMSQFDGGGGSYTGYGCDNTVGFLPSAMVLCPTNYPITVDHSQCLCWKK
jgi:hypothetical protein